jgi:hypothetical protein
MAPKIGFWVGTGIVVKNTNECSGKNSLKIIKLFKNKLCDHQEIGITILILWIFMQLFFLTGVPKITSIENLLKYKTQWIKILLDKGRGI